MTAVGKPRVVMDSLDDAVAAAPGVTAIRDATGAWTYGQLDEAADRVASGLRARGVVAGDRVIMRLRNRREVGAVLFGVLRTGATLVPLSPLLPAEGVASVAADAEPSLVVSAARDGVDLGGLPRVDVEDLVAGNDDTYRVPIDPTGTALLVYTSGSTSGPKGVVCPHAAVDFAARAIAARLRYRHDDVVLVGSPMSFDYGLYQILLSVLARAQVVLADADDPFGMLRMLRGTRATVVPAVPSTARMLIRLARRGPAVGHVRMFTNTGAALTPSDAADLRATFPGATVVAMYGITECKRVTIAEPDLDLERPGSVGPPLPGTTVQILDDGGRPLPTGEVGEIAPVGPHVMDGYRGAPELSARRFDRDPVSGDRRLRTGDYGRLDAAGHLYFHGRRDDQVKRRGVRMSLDEIEAAAVGLPGVTAAAALAPTGDDDLALAVVGDRDGEAVLAALGNVLEPAKVPARCLVVEALPLTPNGKTDRHRLRTVMQPETGSTP